MVVIIYIYYYSCYYSLLVEKVKKLSLVLQSEYGCVINKKIYFLVEITIRDKQRKFSSWEDTCPANASASVHEVIE